MSHREQVRQRLPDAEEELLRQASNALADSVGGRCLLSEERLDDLVREAISAMRRFFEEGR